MLVTLERHGPVAVVRMRRARKRNAIDAAMADEIRAVLDDVETDKALRACVLTGSDGVFSAGTDVGSPPGDSDRPGGEYGVVRRNSDKPLIAAVEGPALGGGFEIVLSCDLVVASETARFGLPEARLGLVASCGGLFRTPRTLPANVAAELILTGRQLDAGRGYTLGLVNVVSKSGRAVDDAIVLGTEIAACAPVPTRHALAALRDYRRRDDDDGWATTERAVDAVLKSPDAAEGVSAFRERRAPVWSV
jgi:enoyl-CoA hydratase/carnithine racemase